MSDDWWKSWLVGVPEYHSDGVEISRFEVSERDAQFDELRAVFNPQRPDRSVKAGVYTSLKVDGTLWMSDTSAEVSDLFGVDHAMARAADLRPFSRGSALIVGLGLGLVLHRAIAVRELAWIDVVEREQRVIDAVGPYYEKLAAEHGTELRIHCSDIHTWRSPFRWDVGFFDIWPTICKDDLPEVERLRRRFRPRLGWFGAWAQRERLASKRRIKNGTGFY